MNMRDLLLKALEIADNCDVKTPKDCAVVYSVSFMPNDDNKIQALSYIKSNPNALMLDNTPCGKALIELGLDGKVNDVGEEITNIWKIASSRYIKEASGNIMAFVDGADERSTFCKVELDEIMNNPQITHINNIKKEQFILQFKKYRY